MSNSKIKKWITDEYTELKLLLRAIPATVVTLFVVSVVCMNLLANKTLLSLPWIALDGGGEWRTKDLMCFFGDWRKSLQKIFAEIFP